MTTETNTSITSILDNYGFDSETGKVFRMFRGPDDVDPREYELPLTDAYLSTPFDPLVEWPDFFGEDAEYFYFPVPPLPGEAVKLCKTKRSSRQVFPLKSINARQGDEVIHLNFSKQITLDVGTVAGDGTITAYWREARLAAIGDSVDMAIVRVGINIVNRLVSAQEEGNDFSYSVRPDILITKLLHKQGVNVAVHCSEVLEESPQEQPPTIQPQQSSVMCTDLTSLLDDPCTDHTLQEDGPPSRRDEDPNFN